MRMLFLESDPQYINALPDGMKQLGCQVMVHDKIDALELETIYQLFRPDVVFTSGWGKLHSTKNLRLIGDFVQRKNLKHCYWATEDPRWTKEWSIPFVAASKPTHVVTIDPQSVAMYQSLGLVATYLPWACNPSYHRPDTPKEEYRCDIAVVATAGVTWSGYRLKAVQLLLKPLIEKGYNLKIWGKRWDEVDEKVLGFSVPHKYLQGPLPYEETNGVYSSAKIVLGIQNRNDELNSRTFEIMAAEGFMLAPDTPGIRKIFVPGKHLAVAGTEQQTLDQVDYYLKNEHQRRAIAQQGRKLVTEKYTYHHRAETVLKILGK